MGDSASAAPFLDSQLFRDAFNASPIGIAVENLDGQPLFVNPAFCRFLGFTEKELQRKHCVDFSPPEDAAKDWALFQKLRAGSIDHYQMEKRYFRRDGPLVWGRLSLSLLNHRSTPLVLAMVEDITETKMAEEARFRLAAIVESSEDAIVSGTPDGSIVSWNAAAQHLYGYTEAEVVGKSISILVPPDRQNEENWIRETLRAGRRIKQLETVRISKTGEQINISLSISPVKDSSGRTVGISGIARDITESKRAEESRLRLAAIVESSDDAIISNTLGGIIVSWNKGAQEIYGYTEAEAVGKPIAILVPSELIEEHNEILEKLRMGNRIEHYETFRVSKGGKKINVSLTISPIKDSTGKTVGISGISRDISARKLADEALLSSEQRYRLLFERNVAGVAIASLDGRLLDCNSSWAHILGYDSRYDLLGHHASEFYFNPAERKPLVDELFHKQVLFSRELQLRRKDGTPVWVMFNAAILHPARETSTVQATMIDISEWKRAEQALSGMTRTLIEAQEQERARIGRELHDDVNQRLAMLSVEVEQLRVNPSDIDDRARELRKAIGEISNDLQSLSHDLHSTKLEYLGVEAGMKSWCNEFAERRKINVDFRSKVSSILPVAVGLSLFRVLQEALQNAVKHSTVNRIEVQLQEESGEIHLIVKDTGRGFDVEAALHGKGLGLTSMRERIRLVNGTISIKSKPMGGTRIHVRVPLELGRGAQRATG